MGEEVSGIWDATPSLVNARNVQRSIWFCFFFFSISPIINSLGAVMGAAAQPGCPLCQEALHHGDEGGGAWHRPPSSQAKPCGAGSLCHGHASAV